jgi:hypothetical protein
MNIVYIGSQIKDLFNLKQNGSDILTYKLSFKDKDILYFTSNINNKIHTIDIDKDIIDKIQFISFKVDCFNHNRINIKFNKYFISIDKDDKQIYISLFK